MPAADWIAYLNPAERARLEEIDTLKRALLDERATLHNRAKLRRHRDQSPPKENKRNDQQKGA